MEPDIGARRAGGRYLYDLATDADARAEFGSDVYDLAVGAGSAMVGLPADLVALASLPHVVNNGGDVDEVFRIPGGSEWISEKLGADTSGLPWLAGQFLDPTGPALDAAKFVAAGAKNFDALALAGMTAWHGSPHKFDRFSLDNIGTGEGAQAYGHGLYFAESEGVAGSYKRNLSDVPGGDLPAWSEVQEVLEFNVAESGDDARRVLNYLAEDADAGDLWSEGKPLPEVANVLRKMAEDEKFVSALNRRGEMLVDPSINRTGEFDQEFGRLMSEHYPEQGHLYEVDIPDEAIDRMLDWDKPLSEQSESVQRTVNATINDSPMKNGGRGLRIEFSKWAYEKGLDPQNPTPDMLTRFRDETGVEPHLWRDKNQNPTGKEIYEWMRSQSGTAEAASAALRELGIPGIKYLDGNSRSAGEGTRNFVVFDENTVKVLSRNGENLDAVP